MVLEELIQRVLRGKVTVHDHAKGFCQKMDLRAIKFEIVLKALGAK